MESSTENGSVQRSGWLSKEGKRLKARSRRYLVLSDSKLSHHVKESSPSTWQIDLNDLRVTIGDRPLQFIISAGGRSVAFFADDADDYNGWVRALKSSNSSVEDFYALGKQLGKGSYGEVFLATNKLTNEQVAVKIIRKNPVNRKQKKFLQREQAIMTTVNHENIVRTVDIFDSPSKLAIVSEYMQGGELFDLIITSQYFTEEVSAIGLVMLLSERVNTVSESFNTEIRNANYTTCKRPHGLQFGARRKLVILLDRFLKAFVTFTPGILFTEISNQRMCCAPLKHGPSTSNSLISGFLISLETAMGLMMQCSSHMLELHITLRQKLLEKGDMVLP